MVKGARRDPVLTSGSREPPDARDTLVAVGNHTGSRPKAHACRCIAASASRISVSKISRTSALEMWNSRALSPETGQPRQPARAPSRPSRPDLLSRQLRTSRSAESSEPASSAGTSYESSRGSRPLLGVIVRPPSGRSQGRADQFPAASAMGRAYPPVSWAQHDVEAPTSRRYRIEARSLLWGGGAAWSDGGLIARHCAAPPPPARPAAPGRRRTPR